MGHDCDCVLLINNICYIVINAKGFLKWSREEVLPRVDVEIVCRLARDGLPVEGAFG